ncbi:MAG: DNA replication/repair protein RecF [Xanthomonadales bacterium]|nr:DNA replication/repair protein RecF [Xanthomonadales bacterium]
MELLKLQVNDLRVIAAARLELAPRLNLIVGGNGAGKTSLLEATFLLSHGRSFRSGPRDALVRQGSAGFSVFGELDSRSGRRRVGLARGAAGPEARIDGATVGTGELVRNVAVLYFGPGSQSLIAGAGEERRRFLDWGVFHVEHDFLDDWRRYQRALKQRNALLRSGVSGGALDAWDKELERNAAPLVLARNAYFAAWIPLLQDRLARLVPELGEPTVRLHPGYDTARPLGEILREHREKDFARGHTGAGPHRADWLLSFSGSLRREHLSRGQEKLCAFACVMAQARLFAERLGQWPILGLDDVGSEIDAEHRERAFGLVAEGDAQILATATSRADWGLTGHAPDAMFHVEHGRVGALV